MNKIKTTVANLRAGDVLGSGFVVSHAYPALTPGIMWVVGTYPNGVMRKRSWNRNTTVTIHS